MTSYQLRKRRPLTPALSHRERGKSRWNWMRFYEGFSWGILIGGAAWATAFSMGCQVHLHYGEKHYDGNAETLKLRNAESEKEPTIEAHPNGEPGIEILIPNGKQ